jgi:hypothetical protein
MVSQKYEIGIYQIGYWLYLDHCYKLWILIDTYKFSDYIIAVFTKILSLVHLIVTVKILNDVIFCPDLLHSLNFNINRHNSIYF